MKKKSKYLFLLLCMPILFVHAQQIVTDNTQQPNELIQNLVGSDCATVSNVSSSINGSINNIISYGAFDKGTSNFPLNNGIILSTGSVSSAGNTISSQNLSEGEIDWVTDSDIQDILGIDQTLNATSIEFDFSSVNNFIAFKYLFASDEYQQEYPCTFKDVFAVLIKRAGTTDPYVNMALVPETTTEITTNSIHPAIDEFCEAENETYFEGYNLGNTNFNGRTTVLTATTPIIPNETYHIKFIIADHIDERFDSAVFISAEGFGNSIDLGPDRSICGSDLTLDADINNAAAIYTWYLNGSIIAGQNNPTLSVNQSGTYSVEASIPSPSGSCIMEDTIDIEIIPFQQADPIQDISICDDLPSDGFFDFDFPLLKNDEIYSNLPSANYIISYHMTQDDAQNNNNPITNVYQNTEETESIYVRIESLSGDCLQIGSFNIAVYNSPNTFQLTVDMCNFFFADLAYNDLDFFKFVVSNYNFNTTVTYFATEIDAINNENILSEFPDFTTEPPALYARVEDDFNGCSSIVPIILNYVDQPYIGRYIINSCLDPNLSETIDGETYDYNSLPVTYNIFEIFDELEAEYPEVTAKLETLILGIPPLITTSNVAPIIPISIRYLDENCPTYMTIEIHKNLLYNLLENDKIITRCDDNSNDGFFDLDLSELLVELKAGFEIDLRFYASENDRDLGINPLDENAILTIANNQSIYLASAYEGCTHQSKITLNLNPGLNLQPVSIDYCGNTNLQNNSSTISVTPLKDYFLEGLTITGPVQFYLSAEDAENEENEITENYTIEGNQQVFYVRMTNIFTYCYDITTMQVNITNTIEDSNPEPLIICDDDQDLTETVNLENVISQLSNGSDDFIFTFFENYNDAVTKESPILNLSSYTTTTTNLFIRAEIIGVECFTIIPYDIFIYANPQLNSISDFISCELDINAPSSFLLAEKDVNIISGQSGMQVLYFETEDNAINRIDPIDKNSPYLPISNPQTIFVRLENEIGNSCFKVAPMNIELRQAPIYNNPTDVFECDINSNGLASTNLTEKITEISAGSTTDLNITFHLSPLNAQIGVNEIPLNFTSTSNPQLIYARIENTDTGCYETQTFRINTLSLPEITSGQSITKCGDNYNFYQEWDLTEIELDILNGRQYNIRFSYFESEEDLLSDNPIINPTTYTNTSNPQTIYAKITNATTSCFDTVSFPLIINSPPPINPFETYNICENTNNEVDLLEINEIVLDNTFNVLISYHENEVDAEANENALNTNYNYTNTEESLFVRVEYSTTNCYAVYPFQLVVNALPIANQPNNLISCDDDFDGLLEFDLTQQNASILGNQNPEDFNITFYNSEVNAIEKNQQINTSYVAQNYETIFVRLENNTTGCFAITQFTTIINNLPLVSIEDQVICKNDIPLVVSAETNNPNDTYFWSTNANTSQIEIFEVGTYSVTITNEYGCEFTSSFNVTESEPAEIDIIETIDFSDPNNITVTVNGIGDYLYQLDNFDPQTSNVFQNVAMGYHTITIIDLNGCSDVSKEVLVVDIPKFFTPNSDGKNDTWHIVGIETLPGTIINIFDRYGKLLTQLSASTPGWNGNYNGTKMPTSDYWFVADVKRGSNTFQIKGHFTLKR